MKLFSAKGVEMMDVKSIERDGDRLLLKGFLRSQKPATEKAAK